YKVADILRRDRFGVMLRASHGRLRYAGRPLSPGVFHSPNGHPMRSSQTVALILLTFVVLPACQARQSREIIQFTNVTIVDVKEGKLLPGMTVVIENGRISQVGAKAAAAQTPEHRIDGTGKFLIPGLWDMHVHLVHGDWFPRSREILLPLFIANGITGVRD